MKCAIEMVSGGTIYTPSFIKIISGILNFLGENSYRHIHSQTNTYIHAHARARHPKHAHTPTRPHIHTKNHGDFISIILFLKTI
jgi:hypothetical protein